MKLLSPHLERNERITKVESLKRDDLIRYCVKKLKMSISDIQRFSQGWEWPTGTYHSTWEILERLGLLKVVEKNKRPRSFHRFTMVETLIRFAADAKAIGLFLHDFSFEFSPDPSIRADVKFRMGHDLFYVEIQSSNITYIGWKRKLIKWNAYKNKTKEWFRVLVIFDERRRLSSIKSYAREILRSFPDRTLFLFCSVSDLDGKNSVAEKAWQTHRSRELVSLVQ